MIFKAFGELGGVVKRDYFLPFVGRSCDHRDDLANIRFYKVPCSFPAMAFFTIFSNSRLNARDRFSFMYQRVATQGCPNHMNNLTLNHGYLWPVPTSRARARVLLRKLATIAHAIGI